MKSIFTDYYTNGVLVYSHQRSCVFGTLCMNGRQFFRQYESFNQYTFLDYLIQVQKKFGKLILFIDRARQHHRSIMVREYIKQNKDVLKVIYFPKGSSEFNAIEECWRQGKYNLLVSKYYPKFVNLTNAISNYLSKLYRGGLRIRKPILRTCPYRCLNSSTI
jgi:transposase